MTKESEAPDDKGQNEEAPEEQPQGLPSFVTDLKSIERQVGEHVITALQHQGTVAVLSTVVPNPAGGQRIVSVPLNDQHLGQVQGILVEANEVPENDVPCIGFHCYLPNPDAES